MTRPVHTMPESLIYRPSAEAWGCTSTPGWVPYPKKIPRRHPLIDAVGRIDDPCDRPVFQAPDWKPKPSFSAPKEGYPTEICNLDDYSDVREQEGLPEGSALINVGKDTPKGINLRIPAVYSDQTCPNDPSVEECCNESRTLDPTRESMNSSTQLTN
ncbi:hypothetical protein Ocin01_02635 [Orchesella cincta]|uniref:Uncharacterized protein n=1 Tax=Orchesella cincta TaxID=48709 RepID=A0A1D2NFF2_ORCCI|nr:hypothetical protein Ocin01_02635 [Orchesella cincta]